MATRSLTPRQHQIVLSSRHADVTVVSGAPGTGKSHTIAAIATDAVRGGETVLIAAKSEATVDALVDLLERTPGPQPVVFGSNERRQALAERLASGGSGAVDAATVAAAEEALAGSASRCSSLYGELRGELVDAAALRALAPGAFAATADLAAISGDIEMLRTMAGASSWWRRRRARRVRARVTVATGAADTVALDVLARAVEAAAAERRQAAVGLATLDADPRWAALAEAYAGVRAAAGTWVDAIARSPDRLDRAAMGSVAALATALRAGPWPAEPGWRRCETTRSPGRSHCGRGRSPTSTTCCRRWRRCSISSCSTRPRRSTRAWPLPRCCAPGDVWWRAIPASCATSRFCPTSRSLESSREHALDADPLLANSSTRDATACSTSLSRRLRRKRSTSTGEAIRT